MHDLVTEHRCGLALWQLPIDSAATLVDTAMNDKVWLEDAGRAARRLAEERFDRDKLAGQLIGLLQVTVDQHLDKPNKADRVDLTS